MNRQLRIIVLVFIGLAMLQNVSGIRCYSCSSEKSWEDCSSKTKEIYCSGSSAKCLKMRHNKRTADNVIYMKTCSESEHCTRATRPECKSLGSAHECDVTCCSGDLCNRGFHSKQATVVLLYFCLLLLKFL